MGRTRLWKESDPIPASKANTLPAAPAADQQKGHNMKMFVVLVIVTAVLLTMIYRYIVQLSWVRTFGIAAAVAGLTLVIGELLYQIPFIRDWLARSGRSHDHALGYAWLLVELALTFVLLTLAYLRVRRQITQLPPS